MCGVNIIRISCLITIGVLFVGRAHFSAAAMDQRDVSTWQGAWTFVPSRRNTWSLQSRIPMMASNVQQGDQNSLLERIGKVDLDEDLEEFEGRGKHKFKKYKKYLLPLLLAYKLKFFTLIPILIGGLVLLTGATGLAGFFFALFAATMGLKGGGDH